MNLFKYIICLSVFLTTNTTSKAQTNICSKVYETPEVEAIYKKGQHDLNKYAYNEILPVIDECFAQTGEMVASLNIVITIDKTGKVIDVSFPKSEITPICSELVKKQILTMEGWIAGKKKDKPVCSKYNWRIGCIKWEEF